MSEPSFFVMSFKAPLAILDFCSSVSITWYASSGTAALTVLMNAGAVYSICSILFNAFSAPLINGRATSGTLPKHSVMLFEYSDASIIS